MKFSRCAATVKVRTPEVFSSKKLMKEQYTYHPLKTYDVLHDEKRGQEAQGNFEEQIQLRSYLNTQMETHLGERFNVVLSRYEYDIKEGKLWGKDMDEPFMESLKRGRDYRRKNGNPVDFAREDAEVIGFEKIQQKLADPLAKVGSMILSISPSGVGESVYKHNFYDIFRLVQGEGGRYIEARRYASDLTIKEYKEKLGVLGLGDLSNNNEAAVFLSNPIEIPGLLMPDDIHEYLRKGKDFLDEQSFSGIKAACKRLISSYAQSVVEQPNNDILHKTLFNAILNKADEVADKIKRGEKINDSRNISLKDEVKAYAFLAVRKVDTGCGLSEGYDIFGGGSAPFSVSEFGRRAEDDPNLCKCGGTRAHFHCPGKKEGKDCNNKIIVGEGHVQCINCGEGKRC